MTAEGHQDGGDNVGTQTTHSVFFEDRLVAYLRVGLAGHIRLGSSNEALCPVGFADITLFDPSCRDLFVAIADKCDSIEAFVFELGLEEMRVVEGGVSPDMTRRRF